MAWPLGGAGASVGGVGAPDGGVGASFGGVAPVAQPGANLIDNAVRAAGSDGTVKVTVREQESSALVEVCDDGAGVPERDRERIFERLVRLDDARSRDAGWAGLGLTIARGIARSHGGDIECLPTGPGPGALFRLRLPVDARHQMPVEPPATR